MILNYLVYTIIFLFLGIASYTDLKTREVPDWLNYSMIFFGLAINLLASIIFNNYNFIFYSIAGFTTFLILGYIMYYTGQWGGGDSKAMMGLGALIGLDYSFQTMPLLLSLLINILIVGAIYGILWSFFLAIKNKKEFIINFKKLSKEKKFIKMRIFSFSFALLLIILLLITKDPFIKVPLVFLIFLLLISCYLWAFVKSIENSAMLKEITPTKLTEGDWIAKDIKINNKIVAGPKDLGIEKKQIKQLIEFYKKGKIKKILIKEGIPFVPSFFIAFFITMILIFYFSGSNGNLIHLLF